MSRGVPVLSQGHVRKASRERVDDRHDGIAIGNGQSPTGEKVVLHVGDEQDVVVAELQMTDVYSAVIGPSDTCR